MPGEAASEVAALSCVVGGQRGGTGDDLAVYLTHAGAVVDRALDLAIARERASAYPAGLSVWVIDADAEPPSADELHLAAGARPDLEVRFVVIGTRAAAQAATWAFRLITVDGNVLDREVFLKAVAIAAGARAGRRRDAGRSGRQCARPRDLSQSGWPSLPGGRRPKAKCLPASPRRRSFSHRTNRLGAGQADPGG